MNNLVSDIIALQKVNSELEEINSKDNFEDWSFLTEQEKQKHRDFIKNLRNKVKTIKFDL